MADDLAIVWFRRDLRLDDNPAWAEATATHRRVLALYLLDRRLLGAAGPFRRRRLLGDVAALHARLVEAGGGLRVVDRASAAAVVDEARSAGAGAVYANADVTPYAQVRDDRVARALDHAGSPGGPGGVVWCTSRAGCGPGPGRSPRSSRPSTGPGGSSPGRRGRPPGTPRSWRATPGALPAPDGPYPLLGGEDGPEEARPGDQGARARLEAAVARADDYADDHDRPGAGRHVGAVGRPALRHAVAADRRRGGGGVRRRDGRRSCASWPGGTGTPTSSPSGPTSSTGP